MKTKKLTEFSKDGFVAYAMNLMHPEIVNNHIMKSEDDNSKWLAMDVLDNDDESEFPVKVMRVEDTPGGFILIAEEKHEVDLAYQLGQISVVDINMQNNDELNEMLSELNKVSKNLEEITDDMEKKTEETAKTLEEVVKNLRGAI